VLISIKKKNCSLSRAVLVILHVRKNSIVPSFHIYLKVMRKFIREGHLY